MPSVVPA